MSAYRVGNCGMKQQANAGQIPPLLRFQSIYWDDSFKSDDAPRKGIPNWHQLATFCYIEIDFKWSSILSNWACSNWTLYIYICPTISYCFNWDCSRKPRSFCPSRAPKSRPVWPHPPDAQAAGLQWAYPPSLVTSQNDLVSRCPCSVYFVAMWPCPKPGQEMTKQWMTNIRSVSVREYASFLLSLSKRENKYLPFTQCFFSGLGRCLSSASGHWRFQLPKVETCRSNPFEPTAGFSNQRS